MGRRWFRCVRTPPPRLAGLVNHRSSGRKIQIATPNTAVPRFPVTVFNRSSRQPSILDDNQRTGPSHACFQSGNAMKKVLIVDDHSDVRRLLKLTLGRDYDVLEAEDGQTALNIVRAAHPDLVVLDVMMPGRYDGLAVLDAIRASPETAGIRVVMVTARGQSSDYQDGIARGADAYFIKPFSPLKLSNLIQELLEK